MAYGGQTNVVGPNPGPSGAGIAFAPNGLSNGYYGDLNGDVTVIFRSAGTIDVGGLSAATGEAAYSASNFRVAVASDGSRVYVTDQNNNYVLVLGWSDSNGVSIIGTIPVGNQPQGVSVTSDGSEVLVANKGDDTVSVIATASNTVVATIPVGKGPGAFGNFIQSKSIPNLFAGTPGSPNCHGASVSALSQQFGNDLGVAAAADGFASVKALQSAITAFCSS